MTYYPKYIKILVCKLENILLGINMVRTETPICDLINPLLTLI